MNQGGKRNLIPGWWPPYLLLHYAGFIRQGEGDYEERNRAAIGRLIEIFEEVTGRRIAPKTMHDQISKAIRTVPRAELDDWVRVQIDERTARRF